MSAGKFSGTHFSNGIYGARGLFEDVPIHALSQREVCVWFNDFINLSDLNPDYSNGLWTVTTIGPGAGQGADRVADSHCGEYLVDAGTTSETGIQAQWASAGTGDAVGEFVIPQDSKFFVFEARVKVDTLTNGFAYVGLAITDTSLMATNGAMSTTDEMGFRFTDGSLQARATRGSASSTSALSLLSGELADNTYIRLGMRAEALDISSNTASGGIRVYVNGREIPGANGAPLLFDATNGVIPNTGLTPSLVAVNDDANDINLTSDYFLVAAER